MTGRRGPMLPEDPAALEAVLRREVEPDRGNIPAYLHRDPGVFALEGERIFERCWLFLGHESEIPEPGDYVTRMLHSDPVILVRGEDGTIRALLNACRHRGMRVCRTDSGNSSHFRCPYHGFTYHNSGPLIGVPYQQEAYGAIEKDRWGLVPAQVALYKGMIFGTWQENPEPLSEYLGHMAWYLDLIMGRDAMEVVGPPMRRRVPSGWKLPSENFASDAYHTMYSHASIAKIGLAPRANFSQQGFQISAGNGHGLGLSSPTESWVLPEELVPAYEKNLSSAQFQLLGEMRNIHALLFPNLAMQVSTVTYRDRLVSGTSLYLFQPVGPAEIEIWTWFLVEKSAPDWWREASKRMFILTFSPSGIFDQDDIENFSDITANLSPRHQEMDYNYQMGLEREPLQHFPGPGTVYPTKYCEANARAFYRRWCDLMLGSNQDGGHPCR